MQWWFKTFAKETRALKMKSAMASHQKLTKNHSEDHQSSSCYNYTRSCQRTQHRPFYGHWHLKQIGKVKKLNKWVSHKLTKDFFKTVILKCHLLFYATMNHFSIRLWRVMKSGFYMTIGDDQLSGWTEKKL